MRLTVNEILKAGAEARLPVGSPDAEVDIVSNAGHGLLFQYPELVTARILRFIDGHVTAGSEPAIALPPEGAD